MDEKQKISFLIPVTNICKIDKAKFRPHINKLEAQKLILLLNKRIDLNLMFDSQQLINNLIMYSGGNLFHLMTFVCKACLCAIGGGREKISKIDIDYAIADLQISFESNVVSDEIYQNIAEVFYAKKLPESEIDFLALKTGMLLQYSDNKKDWFIPHPVVTKIVPFKKALHKLKETISSVSRTLKVNKPDQSWRNLVIAEIELKNIRCFESLKISFTENDKLSDWLMVLGENAAGKTTLLRSIALGLCDQSDAAALMSSLRGDLLRDGADEGYIKIVLCNKDASQIRLLQPQQLHRALLSAFPTISKLKALKNALPEELGQPSPYPSLSEQIVEMIGRANTEEKLNELIEIARQQSSDNRFFQNLDGNNQTNTYTITTTITKQSEKSETLTQKIEPEIDFLWSDIFVCGYGVNRTTQSYINPEGYRTLDAVQSLFTSQVFQDPEIVLRRHSDEVRRLFWI